MKRPYAACRYVCGSLAAVTAVTSALPMTVMANTSSANFDMRRQVVNLTGILNVSDYTGQVTRGDFARMLVNASSYRENLPTSSVSVFADVPSTHPDAIYIRIAASQGWMTGFLGGLFKPEEYITYKDAVKAALTMLGYSDEDFTGDLASSRISKFNYLELNEKVNRQPEEVLNQTDCMNIFYNLLKTKKKDSSEIYGAVLDCELNSDGEINPITILDDERKGPILVRKGFSVIQSVPFGSENANVFLNGTASTLEAVKASQQDAGFAVVYYNVKSKTIWAYTTRGWDDDDLEGNNAYVLLKGEVKNIYYKSTDVMTPTSIRLEIDDDNSDGDFGEDGIDEDGYLTISLNSSELQYLFSIYGGIEVGDEVVMVCNKSGSSYTAVDAIEY
ncbi:S-layer homology domain-containing protein [Enterocloster clostridioformis]|uniref:S-layer protein n=1 Tax=[Clostridium] clostridioforme 90A8 TaxID=999408 RepID=A0A0E2HBE3_9FIRM|nr:S-layer homology domain-containing protein [Enterocloster clostridioformis]ENZ15626.1 S-layer protein [[Clostridium] clostridioforme 90A8]